MLKWSLRTASCLKGILAGNLQNFKPDANYYLPFTHNHESNKMERPPIVGNFEKLSQFPLLWLRCGWKPDHSSYLCTANSLALFQKSTITNGSDMSWYPLWQRICQNKKCPSNWSKHPTITYPPNFFRFHSKTPKKTKKKTRLEGSVRFTRVVVRERFRFACR